MKPSAFTLCGEGRGLSAGRRTVALMAREISREERIALARLDGTAHRLLREKAEHDTCIRELHKITEDPFLLGHAAGTSLGSWQQTKKLDGDRVARMLTAAGADESVRDEVAAATRERLAIGWR